MASFHFFCIFSAIHNEICTVLILSWCGVSFVSYDKMPCFKCINFQRQTGRSLQTEGTAWTANAGMWKRWRSAEKQVILLLFFDALTYLWLLCFMYRKLLEVFCKSVNITVSGCLHCRSSNFTSSFIKKAQQMINVSHIHLHIYM